MDEILSQWYFNFDIAELVFVLIYFYFYSSYYNHFNKIRKIFAFSLLYNFFVFIIYNIIIPFFDLYKFFLELFNTPFNRRAITPYIIYALR